MSERFIALSCNGSDCQPNSTFDPFTNSIFIYCPCSGDSCSSYQAILNPGLYFFELWGSNGGGVAGGRGGYSSGLINFTRSQTLYLFIGTKNFNGGGKQKAGYDTVGGGSTDMRLIDESEGQIESLRSRIIVAGGGGGGSRWEKTSEGGCGGGINGSQSNIDEEPEYSMYFPITISFGATQTSPGYTYNNGRMGYNGTFGIGGDSSHSDYAGGGGGGYYGGAGGSDGGSCVSSGSGGSSFISGHIGCDAIDVNGIHTGKYIHYSGVMFINTTTISCASSGDGSIKITLLAELNFSCKNNIRNSYFTAGIFLFLLYGRKD